MVDVIEKCPSRDSQKPPLLFVHGAYHGAWCWDEHFLDFFAAKGYRSVAVTLRGHPKNPAPKPMRSCPTPRSTATRWWWPIGGTFTSAPSVARR